MAVQKLIVWGASKHLAPPNIPFFDVQKLNNPTGIFLYPLTGLHSPVYSQIIHDPNFASLVQQATPIIKNCQGTEFGIRCSGGRHRSPAFAWYIAQLLGITRITHLGMHGPELEFLHPDVQTMYNLICAGGPDVATRWAKGEG